MPTETDKPATEPTTEHTGLQQTPPAGAPARTAPSPLRMGVLPQTIEEGWRLSQYFAQSELVPKVYRGKPADVLVAIQYGLEVGFAPMQALQSIAVINGRASVWGDGFLALLMSSSLYQDHEEYYEVDGERVDDGITIEDLKKDDTAAICTFWRRGKATPVTRRFSVGQAKKGGLWGKEGPWQNYPDRMMSMRARSWAGRDAFPDLLRGITTAEEARDLPPADAIDIPQPLQPRRASEARATTEPTPAASSPALPAPEPAAAGNPSPAPAASAPENGQEIRGLTITNTAFVRPKQSGVEPYYEITARSTTGKEQTFLTRDEQVYKEAASFEGTDHQVVIGFHEAPKAGAAAKVFVVDRLAIYEGGTPASPNTGELFG